MKVETRLVDELKGYDRNARTHSEAQVKQLAESITKFGWTNPILIDSSDTIIAGHGRLAAAKRLDMREVPTINVGTLDDATRRALVLADNKIALNAGWDWDLLRLEISELKTAGAELGLTGFSESELSNLLLGMNDANAEWKGMPEFDQPDAMAWRTIKVHFKLQSDLDKFAKLIKQKLSDETRYVWFPPVEQEKVAHRAYTDEQEKTRDDEKAKPS